jgi:hypothetical protein
VALRIDQLCEVYDRNILLSGDIQEMLSDRGRSFTRKIDTVIMDESRKQKRDVFCVDTFPSEPLDDEQKNEEDIPNGKFIKHFDLDQDKESLGLKGVEYVYELDHDFVSIKRNHKKEFKEFFMKGYLNYIEGDWVNAQNNFQQAMVYFPLDGPSRFFCDFMEKHKNLAPDHWKGCRDLDLKPNPPESNAVGSTGRYDSERLDQDTGPGRE